MNLSHSSYPRFVNQRVFVGAALFLAAAFFGWRWSIVSRAQSSVVASVASVSAATYATVVAPDSIIDFGNLIWPTSAA